MEKDIIKIGNAGGFWGDDLSALKRQVTGGELDYITSDYLAEITMGILMKQKMKDENMGYVYDFLSQLDEIIEIVISKGIKIITNAGGMNPSALALRIKEMGNRKGLSFKVAAIDGDDIFHRIDSIYPEKEELKNMETGLNFSEVRDKLLSANVYLGVQPVLRALENGADIIVTGRVTDTAITLAPMIHEFGWKLNDWDKLASGVIGGHIIECGSQSTGGNFTDWKEVKQWENIGFPILEVSRDGTFIVTKHEDTGGIVSGNSVKEQLLYEMGDPKEYLSPDVIADFTSIQLEDEGHNRVRIKGIKGKPPTHFLKVSASYLEGYKASGSILVGGFHVTKKSKIFKDIFWKKVGIDFEKKETELLCTKDSEDYNKTILRFSVYDRDKSKIVKFGKEISTLILSGPAGAAVTGGRPDPRTVIGYWPALIRKELIDSRIKVCKTGSDDIEEIKVPSLTGLEVDYRDHGEHDELLSSGEPGEPVKNGRKVFLKDICLARSGDKGDTSNIGVIAKNEIIYECIKKYLTPDKVKKMFRRVCNGKVIRYEVKNLLAFNFLLEESLGGGGAKSVFIDAQGKLYAQELLSNYLEVDEDCYKKIEKSLEID
ncbi:MAG: acyclic terpene utilization AtuA family protein [Acidobacteriota bacterium]